MRRILPVVLAVVVAAPALAGREFVASEADFRCLTEWPLVGKTRVFNAKKRKSRRAQRKLRRIFEQGRKARLPTGTIIQIVPGEAMVKRGGGFNRESGGWEFFRLRATAEGTEIVQRGGTDVVSELNGGCQACHAGAAKFDFVCGENRTCLPIVFDAELILRLQEADPRCQSAP